MKSEKSFLSILFLFLLLFGCLSESKENHSKSVFLDFDKSSPVKASEIFSEAQYIFLEEDLSLPLVRPYKIGYYGPLKNGFILSVSHRLGDPH